RCSAPHDRDATSRLDSEHFRCCPRTCHPLRDTVDGGGPTVSHGLRWHEAGGARPMSDMRRRNFITLLGGGAAWPLAARAQQTGKLPTIGWLGGGTPATQSEWAVAFTQRLRTLGWSEGSSIVIEYRWAEGRPERFAEIAAEFVRLKVDVILAA